VIRMPSGMTLPTAGSKMQVVSDDGSTQATEATVLPGNLLQILNFVGVGLTMEAESAFSLRIIGIQNQNSVRDAGDWEITT